MSLPNEIFNSDNFAHRLTELLNDEDSRRSFGLVADSQSPIAKNTDFEFLIHADTGEYKPHTRVGNKITRYINGELAITSSNVSGTNLENLTAVISTRLEFLVPMVGARKSNNALLNAVRDHIANKLRFADEKYTKIGTQVFLQVINFDFASTGIREQIAGVGDAITLSMYVTFSYIMSGIASDGIQLYLMSVNGDPLDPPCLIPYSKLGIARKLVTESNVFSDKSVNVPISRSLPTSSVLSINVDLLARLTAFDEAMRNYRLKGQIDTLTIKVKEAIETDSDGNIIYEEPTFDMILDLSALNAEQGAICSATVTLVERSLLEGVSYG